MKKARKICYLKIIFGFVLLHLSGIQNAAYGQSYSGGLGMLYFYAGVAPTEVNTSANFEIDPAIVQNFPGISTSLDLEDDLNFPSSNQLFYFKALVGGRFQAVVSYMSLHREGDAQLTRQFAFGDSVYSVGANIHGFFNSDYFSGTLRVSLLRTELATAGISLGGRYLMLDAGIKAESYGYIFNHVGSFDIPVFVPGVHGSVYIIKSLLVRGSLEYFSLKYKETKGNVIEGNITAEYYLLKYLGIGVGYNLTDFSADGLPKNSIYLKDIDYSVKGFTLFAALRF